MGVFFSNLRNQTLKSAKNITCTMQTAKRDRVLSKGVEKSYLTLNFDLCFCAPFTSVSAPAGLDAGLVLFEGSRAIV